MSAAYEQESALIESYKTALTTASPDMQARLEVELAVHETHQSALKAFRPRYTTSIDKLPVTSKDLRRQLHAAVTAGHAAAVDAVDGGNAALLASIAASHAISAESQK